MTQCKQNLGLILLLVFMTPRLLNGGTLTFGDDYSGETHVNENHSNQDLFNINLSNTLLFGTDFTNTNFQGANFNNADVRLATFTNTDLSNTDLRNDTQAKGFSASQLTSASTLVGANLSGNFMDGYGLNGRNLSSSDLSNASLNSADISNSQLQLANFENASLRSVNLSNANVNGTDFTNADLREADFSGIHTGILGPFLDNADLRGSSGIDTLLFGAQSAFGVNLSNTNLSGSFLLDGLLLPSANLSFANLSNADLTNTFLGNANLQGANLAGANLTNTNLHGAILPSSLPTLPVVSGALVYAGNATVTGQTTVQSGGVLSVGGGFSTLGITLNDGIVVAPSGYSGSLTGFGILSGSLTGGVGETIVVSGGTLTLGDANETAGFNFSGTLTVGSNHVILLDADTANLGISTTLADGGTLSTSGAELSSGESLNVTGSATINGSFTNNGTVNGPLGMDQLVFTDDVIGSGNYTGNLIFSDDFSPGMGSAQISLENLGLDNTAELHIELGGLISGTEYDQLVVSGDATLEGSLIVSTIDSFAPAAGNSFDILTASGSINSAFATVNLPSLSSGLAWNVNQGANLLSLAVGIAGDYNADGTVDAADYTVWRDNEGAPAGTLPNDADGGVIGAAQYSSWVANFGATATLSTSVPEPSGLALLVCMAMQLSSRRKRA